MTASAAFALVAATASVSMAAGGGTSASLSRIGDAVTMPAGVTRIAAPAGGTRLTVDVTLAPRNQSALDAFVKAVNTKGDPEYHHFLSKGQFAEYFGASQATITAVESALRSRGLTVGTASPDGLSVPVTTTVSGAETAFGTSINGYRLPDGTTGFANTLAPELPTSIAGDVTGVVGLSNLARPHTEHIARPKTTAHAGTKVAPALVKPAVVSGEPTLCSSAENAIATSPDFGGATDTNGYYSAQSLSAAYGLTNLYSANEYGSGTTVALFELDAYIGSDISAYQSCYGTSARIGNIPVDGGPSGSYVTGESELDIEDLASLSPKANILVYQGPDANAASTSDANVLDTYRRMVTDDNAQMLSTSWGGCETLTATDTSFIPSSDAIFQEAAAQGQSVFVAAGDEGSTTCFGEQGATSSQSTMLDVDYPASSPYVTGVGGTTLPSGSPGTSGSSVWNPGPVECLVNNNLTTCDGGAGGGGVSRFEQLSSSGFQQNVTGLGYANLCSAASGDVCRQVPDVSASADEFQGYPIYVGGAWNIFGGTSAATPTWAAIFADLESSPTCALNGTGLGEVNPLLYSTAAGTGYANDFADVTTGNNDDAFTGYTGGDYQSETGYDLASGLGQPQAGGLRSTFCVAALTSGTTFTAAGPSRVLDTRKKIGVPTTTPVPAGGIVSLNAYGSGGVPAGTTATAVVLNVTVTDTTSGGYLTVYPNGKTITSGSNLNWTPNTTIANLVAVPVGSGGRVEFKNTSGGTVSIVADLFGYYTSGAGSSYTAVAPVRMLDTRKAIGVTTMTPVPAGGGVVLKVAGVHGVPASGATAVVLNVTVTGGTGSGYLTVYPGNDPTVPTGSNVNWTPNETLPNLVTVPLDSSGNVQFHNTSAGTVHIVADLEGYYSATGATFTAAGPERILDTRNATGVSGTTPVQPGGQVVLTVGGANGIPSGIKAVYLNVTVTGGSGTGYLTVYPDGVSPVPTASNVNWLPGETIPNAVLVSVGSDGKVVLHNTSGGTVHIVADVFGYFS